MDNQRGNALLYVLIGIVLFAGLSFVLSEINKNADVNSISSEQAKLKATDIVEYARILKNAVQIMKAGGVSEDEYCFHNDQLSHNSYDIAACSSDENNLFSLAGGAVNFRFADKKWLDDQYSSLSNYGEFVFTGRIAVKGVGSDGNGDSSTELIVYLPYLQVDICNKINSNLGISSEPPPSDEVGGILSSSSTRYGDGGVTFSDSAVIGDNATELEGVRAGCAINSANQYYFYYVLLSR